MLRRIVPLLLALAVAGAPVALELCHIACASLSPQSDARAGAHTGAPHAASCHDAPTSPAPLSLHAHACDHGDELPTPAGIGSARQGKFGAALTAVPLTASSAAAPLDTRTSLAFRASVSTAARTVPILPLRI